MKNITLLSLVAAALLFTACGEKTKEAATEATNKVTEAVKEDTTSAMEATKKAAAEVAESAKAKVAEVAEATAAKAAEVQKAAEDKAAEAAQALKERAAATTAASATESVKSAATSVVESAKEVVADNTAGKVAYAKCAGCHGTDGKTKALGKSAVIAGQSASELVMKLTAYKAGSRNAAGMGMLMKSQVASMSDEDIKAVAAYISSL